MVDYYTKQETVPLEYDCPTSCVKLYIPLTIFCYKEKYTKSEATATARMLTLTGAMTHERNKNIHGKITENINDLFAVNSPYVILIEGTAGIGKTTLCKEIALQWANKNILQYKTLLFLLFMHNPEIKNLISVELLVKHFFQSEILANKITDWLIETDGEYLTIIIDGYSEDCGNQFITDYIIGRKIFGHCNLVITCRSPAPSHLSEIVNHREIILGFSKSNQINFIYTALKGLNSEIDNLKSYLQSNPIIGSLCNIPLIMNMLLQFVEDRMDIVPKIQTSWIQKYIVTIIKKKTVTKVTDLPCSYDQTIKDLSQFAFIALQENQLTFTVDEILELCENNFQVYWYRISFLNILHDLGLLNRVTFRAQDLDCETFHFNHTTVQEYLAAYYISFLPDSELLKLLHGTFGDSRYFNIWVMYAGITRGKCDYELFRTSSMTMKPPSNIANYYLYQLLHCLIEADGDPDSGLLRQNIDLKYQILSYDDLHTLAKLLSRSTNKHWKNLNLSHCSIDDQGCVILSKMLHLSAELKFETVDISNNNFHWESFYTICTTLNFGHAKKLVFSINALYDTITINKINSFTALLKENIQENILSDEILLLTYLAKQKKLIAVYSAPDCIRWFQWNDSKLNRNMIKHIKDFTEHKVGKRTFQIVFNYSFIDYHGNIENLSALLSNIQHIQLCGSYLHSKGAYSFNFACTIDCQYNSPQEILADYLAAVLCHNAQSKTPYLESLLAENATLVKSSLQSALSMRILDISSNSINNQIATEIGIIISFTRALKGFHASSNNLLEESTITIAKHLQNISTFTMLNISNNSICGKAVDAIAIVLSHNTSLQQIKLSNNNLETVGMIKIAKALQNISTLTTLSISNNNVGEEAADDIATVLSHNSNLQKLYFSNNSFKTVGMIKIAKALQNVSTLTTLSINNNNIGEEAAEDIATVLSNNTQLQTLHLSINSFKTVGMIKIAKALQNVSGLTALNISNNNVSERAADDIATVLSHNSKLQQLYFSNNSFKTVGMIKIAKALQNVSTLTTLDIRDNNVGEEAADHIAIVLSHNSKLQQLYFSNNSFKTVGMIKIAKALQNVSTLTTLDINDNNVGEEAADYIAIVLSHNSKLQQLYFSNNSFKTVRTIKIAKALQNVSTLTTLGINNNNVGEEAADDIATVLSHNSKLQQLDFSNNSFKTVGIIKIAKALKNVSTLITLIINNNNVGKEAADDIATVLSHNSKLQHLDFSNNSLMTVGMIKIAKALQNVSTLTTLDISDNNVGEEAADNIAIVLSHNSKIQQLYFSNNSFKTVGMIKIAKSLQNVSTLTTLGINNNNVGEEAADDIATVLSHNSKLQQLDFSNNIFKTVGIIKIAKALQNVSTLTTLGINNNNVGEEAADDIATVLSHNSKLQLLDFSNNSFKTVGMIKIAKAFQITALRQ